MKSKPDTLEFLIAENNKIKQENEKLIREKSTLLKELHDKGLIDNTGKDFHTYFDFGYQCASNYCKCKQ